jgi:hypothetical protein
MNNVISSEFYESQFQAFVEMAIRNFFTFKSDVEVYYGSGGFENKHAYDIKVEYLFPIYYQVKRSEKISAESDILADRKRNSFSDRFGAFAFHLHKDKKQNSYKQHNILFSYKRKGYYCRYIAPLFHTHKELEGVWKNWSNF